VVSWAGVRCHFPRAYVAYSAPSRISERKPLACGMVASYPGKPCAISAMRAMPLLWWLRPESRHARVGEHSAVVWKLLYRRPSRARRSNVGVVMSDP
jgi:hypothetical protein